MTYRAVADGDRITVTAGGAVTAGQVWAGTEVAGIYLGSATGSGVSVAVAVEGVYTCPKKAGANLDFAVGEMAYALSTGGIYTAVPTGATVPIGYAVVAAATGDTSVTLKLSR